jgi:hypothetical protein
MSEDGVKSILSTKYRGKRYGFTQKSEYIPALNRYVNLYDKDGQTYYGYENSEYKSPALIQNIVSNHTFETTSGWTGTHNTYNNAKQKATIERVYGYFDGDPGSAVFVNALEELEECSFNPNTPRKTYLKITFPSKNSMVINSGPYDNRTMIENMESNEEWALRYICRGVNGQEYTNLNWDLGEYTYYSVQDRYKIQDNPLLTFSKVGLKYGNNGKKYSVFKVGGLGYNKENFKKKMKVRLALSLPSASSAGADFDEPLVLYLEEIELFRVSYYNQKIITPEE